MKHVIRGNYVDMINRDIYPAAISVDGSTIVSIKKLHKAGEVFIIPGLIDAHVHVESSLLVPSEFARLAVRSGTVASVSDPHEIANVLGVDGVMFMIENGRQTPFKFYFGSPSCVPATPFEHSGGEIGIHETELLLSSENVHYLAEVMNFPGVINGSDELLEKIRIARKYNKPVDGHAPGLTGGHLDKYIRAGITTDHECTRLEEAEEKIRKGMNILIREGSAAKNLEELFPLVDRYPDHVMLCSDDLHPDELLEGHINKLLAKGTSLGIDLFHLLQAACINPAKHYRMDTGRLQAGDPADIVVLESLESFRVLETYINGEKVYENGQTLIDTIPVAGLNNFKARPVQKNDLFIRDVGKPVRVIRAHEDSLLTESGIEVLEASENGALLVDLNKDVLKIAVYNRYESAPPALGFINGFGLKSGALASSIAHDSHNIIAVGTNDDDLEMAINAVVDMKGGIVVAENGQIDSLKLNIAGIMTDRDGQETAELYDHIVKRSRALGACLKSPLMTLSFMALLVIPELKMSDQGLFDVSEFNMTSLYHSD